MFGERGPHTHTLRASAEHIGKRPSPSQLLRRVVLQLSSRPPEDVTDHNPTQPTIWLFSMQASAPITWSERPWEALAQVAVRFAIWCARGLTPSQTRKKVGGVRMSCLKGRSGLLSAVQSVLVSRSNTRGLQHPSWPTFRL